MAFNYIPKIVYTPSGGSPTTINFEFPPEGFDSEGRTVKSEGRMSKAANGVQQFSSNYIEETYEIRFAFLTKSIRDQFETFMQTHAMLGFEFDYYVHASEASSKITVELTSDGMSYRPQKHVPAEKYRPSLKFRRVIG